jgi:hypothetical protein
VPLARSKSPPWGGGGGSSQRARQCACALCGRSSLRHHRRVAMLPGAAAAAAPASGQLQHLNHEVLDDAVEGGALVAKALLAGGCRQRQRSICWGGVWGSGRRSRLAGWQRSAAAQHQGQSQAAGAHMLHRLVGTHTAPQSWPQSAAHLCRTCPARPARRAGRRWRSRRRPFGSRRALPGRCGRRGGGDQGVCVPSWCCFRTLSNSGSRGPTGGLAE